MRKDVFISFFSFLNLAILPTLAGAATDARQVPPIAEVTVREIQTTPETRERLARAMSGSSEAFNGGLIWDLVVKSKPVVQTSAMRVSALPVADQDWAKLDGWKGPVMKTYLLEARNILGLKSISFEYAVSAFYGGSLNGVGAYLANVTILPIKASALWGYSLDARVEAGTPINVGTGRDPVAAIPLDLVYSVGGLLSRTETRLMYVVTGDGQVSAQR